MIILNDFFTNSLLFVGKKGDKKVVMINLSIP